MCGLDVSFYNDPILFQAFSEIWMMWQFHVKSFKPDCESQMFVLCNFLISAVPPVLGEGEICCCVFVLFLDSVLFCLNSNSQVIPQWNVFPRSTLNWGACQFVWVNYNRTSEARTLMARLSRLFRTRAWVPRKNLIDADLRWFRMIFLFTLKMVYCVYLLESPRWSDSNDNTQKTFMLDKKKRRYPFYASLHSAMLNTH